MGLCASTAVQEALDAATAEVELQREAAEGRLDPDAVDAVLAAAATVSGSALVSCRPG